MSSKTKKPRKPRPFKSSNTYGGFSWCHDKNKDQVYIGGPNYWDHVQIHLTELKDIKAVRDYLTKAIAYLEAKK